ncbi:MAG: DsbA family oxidoreductase [Pseudorhodoplanes sp.]
MTDTAPPQASRPVRIDVVSDVVCPWCLIGKRRLEKALAMRPDIPAIVRFHPFFLNDWIPREGIDRNEYLTAKFGSPERYRELSGRVVEAAQTEGLVYAPDKISRQPNTLDCHRLIHWAGDEKGPAMKQRLLDLYFSEGADLTDSGTLVKAAADIGLDPATIHDRLAGDDDVELVSAAAERAKQSGVDGVPYFIFDSTFAVSGAQSPDYLVQAMEHALAQRKMAAAE